MLDLTVIIFIFYIQPVVLKSACVSSQEVESAGGLSSRMKGAGGVGGGWHQQGASTGPPPPPGGQSQTWTHMLNIYSFALHSPDR